METEKEAISQSDTLQGGREIKVALVDGTEQSIKVLQLPLGKYEKAFLLLDDEIGLTCFICGKDKSFADKLTPEAYELIFIAAQEVNERGFFLYAARQAENLSRRINAVNPELIKAIQAPASQSPNLPQGSRRRPV